MKLSLFQKRSLQSGGSALFIYKENQYRKATQTREAFNLEGVLSLYIENQYRKATHKRNSFFLHRGGEGEQEGAGRNERALIWRESSLVYGNVHLASAKRAFL